MRERVAGAIAACAIVACAPTRTPVDEASIAIARGDVAGAIKTLTAHLAAHADDARAWVKLGNAYELSRRFDDAAVAYDRAAEVAPNDPVGPREGGRRRAAWGDAEGSKSRLIEAIRRGDDDPETHHALGVVLLSRGDLDGAERAYTAGLATPRGAKDAACVLGLATIAVARGDGAAALRWYDELLARRPNAGAVAELGRAWALGKLGKIDDAKRALDAAAAAGAKAEDVARVRAWLDGGATITR